MTDKRIVYNAHMMRPDETYISTSEAAQALGISRQRVLQLIRGERLKATKFANVFMIRRTDLAAVEDRPQGRPPKAKTGTASGQDGRVSVTKKRGGKK